MRKKFLFWNVALLISTILIVPIHAASERSNITYEAIAKKILSDDSFEEKEKFRATIEGKTVIWDAWVQHVERKNMKYSLIVVSLRKPYSRSTKFSPPPSINSEYKWNEHHIYTENLKPGDKVQITGEITSAYGVEYNTTLRVEIRDLKLYH